MAEGGVLVTGLKEAYANVEALDTHVTEALKGVAHGTADRINTGYRERLRSQTHGTGRTANSSRVLDESAEKQFTVNVPGDPEKWPNLPGALEYGTRFMSAKPSLRPAGDAENERYKADMATAAERVVKGTI